METKRLQVGECRFNYLDGGPAEPSRPTLVFLHGWASAAYPFAEGLERLARGRRVVAPDLPGFNQSRCRTPGWGYAEYALAIHRLAQALGLSAFHLAGHSTGGGIAIELAAARPQSVLSLTLIDSTGVPLGSMWRVAVLKGVEQVRQAWDTRLARGHVPLGQAAVFDILFRTRAMWSSLRMPLEQDLRPRLKRVTAPAQVVWGERDLTEPLKFGRELAEGLGAPLVCLPGAYHEWSVLCPQLLEQTLGGFMEAVDSGAGPQARPVEIR